MLKKYTAKPLGMIVAWGEAFAIAKGTATAKGNAIAFTIPNAKGTAISNNFAYLDKDCERYSN